MPCCPHGSDCGNTCGTEAAAAPRAAQVLAVLQLSLPRSGSWYPHTVCRFLWLHSLTQNPAAFECVIPPKPVSAAAAGAPAAGGAAGGPEIHRSDSDFGGLMSLAGVPFGFLTKLAGARADAAIAGPSAAGGAAGGGAAAAPCLPCGARTVAERQDGWRGVGGGCGGGPRVPRRAAAVGPHRPRWENTQNVSLLSWVSKVLLRIADRLMQL